MSNKVVPIRRAQPGRLKMLNELAAEADRVAARNDELEKLVILVRENTAPKDAKQIATLSRYDEALVARCTEALELLDANESYEDDDQECGLRRDIVSARLAILIGAFPNSGGSGWRGAVSVDGIRTRSPPAKRPKPSSGVRDSRAVGGYSNNLVRKLSLLHLATMSHERSNDSRGVSENLPRSKP
jgi:hypothetical protein